MEHLSFRLEQGRLTRLRVGFSPLTENESLDSLEALSHLLLFGDKKLNIVLNKMIL